MNKKEALKVVIIRAREWLVARLAPYKKPSPYLRLAIACASVFLIALGVRFLHWQDLGVNFEKGRSFSTVLIRPYQKEVSRMAEDGGILFPSKNVDPGDARMIVHPPGYSILIRLFYGVMTPEDRSYIALRLAQVLTDSAAVVLVFLIAAELLAFSAALMSALLAAVSPHLAYYSLWLSPETFSALPILIAVYLLIKAHKRPRLIAVATAGAMIGLSCWLRSSGLLLAPVLAFALLFLIERGKRWRYSAVFLTAAIIVIAPITIRNWLVYGHFIPLSIGSGITMIEGISDYDNEARFGLPATDDKVAIKDAEWHNCPDYEGNIWMPDGIARDRYRFQKGLEIIVSNPVWFSGVMLRRATFMVKYNDGDPAAWPLNTHKAPVVSTEPPFGHSVVIADESLPVWTSSARELIADGAATSPQAEVSLADNSQVLEIKGDRTEFQDQFASAPIAIKERTDYVLKLSISIKQGTVAAAKVTSADRRITLASGLVLEPDPGEATTLIDLPFASGNKTEARLVISNDTLRQERAVVQVGRAELFEIGPTPQQWTAQPRALIRGLQKNIFKTDLMRVLIVLGIALLAAAKRKIALLCLLAVPVYYLCAQSALHTEYRYTLVIHYFLFVMAAVALYTFGIAIIQAARKVLSKS